MAETAGMQPKVGALRVWWQTGSRAEMFFFDVASPENAVVALSTLTHFELTDPSVVWNAGGLEIWDGSAWAEWYDEDGDNIDEYGTRRDLEKDADNG